MRNCHRWGGVVLINPSWESCEDVQEGEAVTVVPEETTVVGTFLAQLRLLLGIPETVMTVLRTRKT